MKPNNTSSIFLSGESAKKILFQSALYWAECGELIWFISPSPFTSLPTGWTKPKDKETLKLIYFLYIPETKDLLQKLSDIHLLPRLPKMIIVTEIDYYLFPKSTETNFTKAAFLVTCLLDSISVYASKYSASSFLLATCKNNTNEKLQTLLDLYFSHNFHADETTYDKIKDIF